MNIPDALNELGSLLNLPELALNDEGVCRLVFDEDLTLDFESMADGRMLHLSTAITTLDTENQNESFFQTLLHANLLGLATGGAHFSVNEASDEVLLERTLKMDQHDATGFCSAVESFVNHLEGWKERLSSLESQPPDASKSYSGLIRI